MKTVSFPTLRLLPSAILTLCFSLPIAWAWTVLVAGRALPWEATREWALVFLGVLVITSLLSWRHWRGVSSSALFPDHRRSAAMWLAGPPVAVLVLFLAPVYLSDGVYGFLLIPFYRIQLLAGAAIVTVLVECFQLAAAVWGQSDGMSAATAIREAVARRREVIIWGTLLGVGILVGMSRSSPINDDIGKYWQAAVAMMEGAAYPVHTAGGSLVEAGMTPDSPALPALPVLLATSFAFLGQNYFGLAVPLAVLAAAFPIAFCLACLAFTGSKQVAYSSAILLALFPPYRLHVIGTAVPDTLFVVMLLLTAAAAAKATETMRWHFWVATGLGAGLAANSRPEGLDYSLGIMAILFIFYFRAGKYWLAALVYALVLTPFALTYRAVEGSLWPTTFDGTVGLQHVEPNLTYLRDLALPWYEQAIGLSAPALAVLGILIALGGLGALVLLWKNRPGLLFIPLLGYGYIASSLMIHPLILMSFTPVDVLRHWSSGIPYIVLSLAYVVHRGTVCLAPKLSKHMAAAAILVAIVLLGRVTYYECERLARPEWYFGGSASLLWTGNSYLLTDLAQNPLPLPRDDPLPWERVRAEQFAQLGSVSLRTTNRSEPYYWSTLILALFGLALAFAPGSRRREASKSALPLVDAAVAFSHT